MHGPNPEFRKRILDKASLWIVAIAVVVAVIGFALFGNQLYQNGQQNAVIINQQQQITSLLQQHSGDLALQKRQSAQFAAAEKVVQAEAIYIAKTLNWEVNIVAPLCSVSPVHACPPPPAVPGTP
jgi:hypothetical protein